MHRSWWKKGLAVLAVVVVIAAAVGWIVAGLWNWLMPPLFGLATITFWQALGLFLLGKLLFGGLRGFAGAHGRHHRRWHERWRQMTPEERESFSRGLKYGCPRHDRGGETSRGETPGKENQT